MNGIVDFFRDYWNDYWAALPFILVVVFVALLVMGFQRIVRSGVRDELDKRDRQRRDQ